MSKLYAGLAGAFALGAIGLATAQAQSGSADHMAGKIVAARQASLAMSAVTFGAMKHASDAGAEAKTQGFSANALARWAKVLPTMFPAGTGADNADGAKTRALPTIWSDQAGFAKAAGDYADATAKLLDLAKAGDTPGFKAQLDVVDKTCDACHETYRAKPAGH
jgi:cytochrome c556